jgi:hypothetical protein
VLAAPDAGRADPFPPTPAPEAGPAAPEPSPEESEAEGGALEPSLEEAGPAAPEPSLEESDAGAAEPSLEESEAGAAVPEPSPDEPAAPAGPGEPGVAPTGPEAGGLEAGPGGPEVGPGGPEAGPGGPEVGSGGPEVALEDAGTRLLALATGSAESKTDPRVPESGAAAPFPKGPWVPEPVDAWRGGMFGQACVGGSIVDGPGGCPSLGGCGIVGNGMRACGGGTTARSTGR